MFLSYMLQISDVLFDIVCHLIKFVEILKWMKIIFFDRAQVRTHFITATVYMRKIWSAWKYCTVWQNFFHLVDATMTKISFSTLLLVKHALQKYINIFLWYFLLTDLETFYATMTISTAVIFYLHYQSYSYSYLLYIFLLDFFLNICFFM